MDHSELDEQIVGAIRAGNTSFTAISTRVNTGIPSTDPAFIKGPLIDRRLQVLRRRGQLTSVGSATRSSWKLAQEPTA